MVNDIQLFSVKKLVAIIDTKSFILSNIFNVKKSLNSTIYA